MSKTWTRKIHQGQIQKKENEIERQKAEAARKEEEEAARWAVGAKEPNSHDLKVERLKEREEKKKRLRELYEQEMADDNKDL